VADKSNSPYLFTKHSFPKFFLVLHLCMKLFIKVLILWLGEI